MLDPDCVACPKCGTPWYSLKPKNRWMTDKFGDVVKAGRFDTCKCGAYTRQSTGQRRYNLKTSVARKFRVSRKFPIKRRAKQLDLFPSL